jgi:CubicO group peptidase (beta-lactamase class C family)
MDTRFRGVCEQAAERWSVPALAVGVSVGGDAETLALGCDPGTRFRIASITKPMTAALALSVLDPDEAVEYWPADVRVRHLLSHLSGFDCELSNVDQLRFGDEDGALDACVAELPGVRRFVDCDDIWSYANTGYWLAGWLAGRRAGTTYEKALAERVLEPAGLAATSFEPPALAGTGPDARTEPYPRARRPSGGLTSDVGDLLRFGAWLLRAPVGEQMRVVQGKPVGGVYGLGLFGERVGGVEVWGHSGSYGGFQSSLLTVPARDAVFAGLTNASRGAKALRLVEDEFFRRVLGEPRREAVPVTLADAALEAFEGAYENNGGRNELRRDGSGSVVAVFDGVEYTAEAIGERTFQIAAGDRIGERFDFPREGLARFGSRLAARVA